MFDKLGQLLNRRTARRSDKAAIRVLPSDFSGMPTYQRLEAMSQTSHLQCAANSSRPISWQLPLPYDLIYHIINYYLLDVHPTLYNLSTTCRSLAALCRPLRFQTVTISTKARKSPTACEKLATLLGESPDVIDYIQNLRVLDHGKMFQGSRPITVEEECLCLILTRPYPNLQRLELSLRVVWTLLSPQVQHAFGRVFSLPSLQTLSWEHVRIPVDLLSYLASLPSLETRGEISPPCYNDAYPNTRCTPKTLKYSDRSISGFISENMFSADSALLLDKLEYLEACAPVHHFKFLQPRFQNCYQTLTTLKIYPLNRFVDDASPLDLQCLARLTSLVLYASICETTYVTDILTGAARNGFWWMLNTLRTCHQPSSIESLAIVIQTKDVYHTKKCPWEEVERVLRPGIRWQQLKELHIRHNEPPSFSKNRRHDEGCIDGVVLPKIPVLAGVVSVRFTVSNFRSILWGGSEVGMWLGAV